MNMRTILHVLPTLIAVACADNASAAEHTADSRAPHSPGLIGEAERWLQAAAAVPTVASDPATHGGAAQRSSTAERGVADDSARATAKDPWVDFVPNLSVVVRDWRGSLKLAGDRTLLVDDIRPTASNRMVIGRLATDAQLTTFVQVGVGEWRIDTVMFPNARAYRESAGQVSGGFELHAAPGLRVAGEVQYTVLYRDLHYTSDEVAPRILTFVVAVDARF